MTDCPHTSLETHDAARGTLRCMLCDAVGTFERVGDSMRLVHEPPRPQVSAPQVCVRLSPPMAEALKRRAGARHVSETVREAIGAFLATPGVICLSGELAEQVRQAADEAGVTPRHWLESAVRERLTNVQQV